MSTRNHDISTKPPAEHLAPLGIELVNEAHNDPSPSLNLLRLSLQRKDTDFDDFDAAGMPKLTASCAGAPTTPIGLPLGVAGNGAEIPEFTHEAVRQFAGQSGHEDDNSVLSDGLSCNLDLETLPPSGYLEYSAQSLSLAASTSLVDPDAGEFRDVASPSPNGNPKVGVHDPVQSSSPLATQDVSQSVAGIGTQFDSCKHVVDKFSGVSPDGPSFSCRSGSAEHAMPFLDHEWC